MRADAPLPADEAIRPVDSLLAGLGVHGWDDVELALLSGVMLGEPTLLVSEPGSAKTYVGHVLSSALSEPRDGRQLRFGYYDISKANFEDIIGFPDVEAFKHGRSEFIHNQTTIWDKNIVMVDEVSRAARDTSNKWLEVLGSRKLMGHNLPVRVMLGGMNPTDHQGTGTLDQAFADRFVLFIRLPEFTRMNEEVRNRILSGVTGLDAPSVSFWAGDVTADEQRDYVTADDTFDRNAARLREVLRDAARRFQRLSDGPVAMQCARYADVFARALLEADVRLEPRRLKMLKRSVLAAFAVRGALLALADDELPSLDERVHDAGMIASMALPHPYTPGPDVSIDQVTTAHMQAAAALREDVSELMLFNAQSHAQRLALLLTGDYKPTVQEKVVADFLADETLEGDMTAWVLGQLLIAPPAARLDAHLLNKLSERFKRAEAQFKHTAAVRLDISPDIADQFDQTDRLSRLVEHADQRVDTRVAMAWALGQGDADPATTVHLYPKALRALQQAMTQLRDVCVAWGVDGAATWQPSDVWVPPLPPPADRQAAQRQIEHLRARHADGKLSREVLDAEIRRISQALVDDGQRAARSSPNAG